MRIILILFLFLFSSGNHKEEKPELICIRNNKSSNTCYYNFKIEGVKYHFRDIGCKYDKTKVLEKIEEGSIALAHDWKVSC